MTALPYRHAERLWPAPRAHWPAMVRLPYLAGRRVAARHRPRRTRWGRALSAGLWHLKAIGAALAAAATVAALFLALVVGAWLTWPLRHLWGRLQERRQLRLLNSDMARAMLAAPAPAPVGPGSSGPAPARPRSTTGPRVGGWSHHPGALWADGRTLDPADQFQADQARREDHLSRELAGRHALLDRIQRIQAAERQPVPQPVVTWEAAPVVTGGGVGRTVAPWVAILAFLGVFYVLLFGTLVRAGERHCADPATATYCHAQAKP